MLLVRPGELKRARFRCVVAVAEPYRLAGCMALPEVWGAVF